MYHCMSLPFLISMSLLITTVSVKSIRAKYQYKKNFDKKLLTLLRCCLNILCRCVTFTLYSPLCVSLSNQLLLSILRRPARPWSRSIFQNLYDTN